MATEQFSVIYTGKLNQDVDAESAARQFAQKFKLSPEKALKIINAGKEVTIKARTEHVMAYKLKSALEGFGLQIRLQRAANKPILSSNTSSTTKDATGSKKQPTTPVEPQLNNPGTWQLEPIPEAKEEQIETEATSTISESRNSTVTMPVETSKKNTVSSTSQQTTSANKTAKKQSHGPSITESLFDLIRKFGGAILAVLALVLLAIKKFGLFKLLKIGGLMTATAFAGYSEEDMCMGNERCEEAVSDQLDACWEGNGFDEYDWENMSDTEYFNLKPKIEKEFISCFRYEDTDQRVFLSPIELYFDIYDNCQLIGNDSCGKIAEPQIQSCHLRHDIGDYVSADTPDYYSAIIENPSVFKDYFNCFKDNDGTPLFAEIMSDWDAYYGDDY